MTGDRTTESFTDATVGAVQFVKGVAGLVRDAPVIARPTLRLMRSPGTVRCVGGVFESAARAHPNRSFLWFDGRSITYAEANHRINRYAHLLKDNGIGVGDTVAVLGRNHPTVVLSTLAVVKLGATAGLLNYNLRGDTLAHGLRLLDARAIVVDPDLDILDTVDAQLVPALRFGLAALDEESAALPETNPSGADAIDPNAAALLVFTSGTTGMPKASVMSHRRWVGGGLGFAALARLRPDDVLYCALPLYHNNAMTASLGAAVASGACLAIGRRFSASGFWDDVIDSDATAFVYIGEVCRYLLAQPPKPTDRQHRVRVIMGNGLRSDIWQPFVQRFGIDRVAEFYAGSELPGAAMNFLGTPGSAGIYPALGRAVVRYDPDDGRPVRDARGRVRRVRKGEPGLLLIRNTRLVPFEGYTDAEATADKLITDAFRPGDSWVNTGDLVRDQGFGHIAFVDRLGDTFRWKGENVATSEVEAALNTHPHIAEAAVYGVAVPGSDGKAGMAAVTMVGDALDLKSIAAHLNNRLPGYAVPVFIRVVDELDHTSTFKAQKTRLRALGTTATGEPIYRLSADGRRYEPYSG